MPPGAEWEWLEAYGLIEADPDQVHGDNWSLAVATVNDRLEELVGRNSLEARLVETRALANRPPHRILHRGSGWGALERIRREKGGEASFCTQALVFDNKSLTADQAPWLSLLTDGALPNRQIHKDPGAWMVQEEWISLLEEAVQAPVGDHWLSHLHLGLMYYARGDRHAASCAWQKSLAHQPSGWAHRNLAATNRIASHAAEALAHYVAAIELAPRLRPLVVEYCEYLLELGRPQEVLGMIDQSIPEVRAHSRVQFLEARAGLALRLCARYEPILEESYELVDIREGESSLTEFWSALMQVSESFGEAPLAHARNGRPKRHETPRRLDFEVAPQPSVVAASDTLRPATQHR